MKMKFSGLILLCTFVSYCIAAKPGRNGYIFTCPRTLMSGTNNEIHFQIFDNSNEGTLKVTLFYKQSYDSVNETIAAVEKYQLSGDQNDVVLDFPLPNIADTVYSARIQINGSFGSVKISGTDDVNVSPSKQGIVFIQTDKPIYQPGQTVKFRVLKVDKKLKPTERNSIADVFVEDPTGIRLFQFKNIHLGNGIIENQFPLLDEPTEGYWTIKVVLSGPKQTTETTSFQVKKYVLPKFEVNINFPPFVLANAETIPVEVCATYTYGKPVIGTLNLNVSLEQYYYVYSDSENLFPTLQKSVKLDDGCYKYKINVSKIEKDDNYSYRRVMVVANVEEEGTGVQINKTAYLQRQTSPLQLEFVESLDSYKPNLPYNGKLKVSNPDNTPASCESIQICATINKQRILAGWSATKTLQICQNYTSDEDGIIPYIIPSQNVDVTSITLDAKSLKYAPKPNAKGRDSVISQPQTSKYLNAYYSPSGNFIQLQPVAQPIPCGSSLPLKLLFTSDKEQEFKFYYQIVRQSKVVYDDSMITHFSKDDDVSEKYAHNEEVIDGDMKQLDPPPESIPKSKDKCPAADSSQKTTPIGEVDFEIEVDQKYSPTIYMLIYYIRSDGEVVADSAKFSIEHCFPNKVDFAFVDSEKQPGTNTGIKISAAPKSLCGIKAIDKSVALLDNSDQLTPDTVFQKIESLDDNQYYASDPCYRDVKQPGLSNKALSSIVIFPPISSGSYDDSLTAFQTSGMTVISDFFIVTRPCTRTRSNPRLFPIRFGAAPRMAFSKVAANDGQAVGGASTVSAKAVRDFFPETWLFEMETVGSSGELTIQRQLPDTITQWIGSAVCINSEDGLGLSNKANITAFQAFFIDYTLPISAIRGERFVVVVSISNYLNQSLPITVKLDNPDGLKVVGDSINGDICIKPNNKKDLRLVVQGTKVGNVNITVHAETSKYKKVCMGNSVSNAFARDAITKPIEILAEGFPQDKVINSLFCPSDNDNGKFETQISLTVPEDVVPDSSRAYIDFTGNVMGPAINNLDNLIALPTGCGEQNMAKTYSNYVVLDYLNNIGMLSDDLKTRAINNLNTGYQRELQFRHPDASFSAFGTSDNSGSMWLTAYVLKCFSEMKKYIYIDDTVLEGAQNFIVSHQDENGCFPNVGQVIDIDLEGGIKDQKASGSITAFVTMSLSISGYANETVIDSALNCLTKNPPNNPYTQLLYAYAQALAGKTDDAQNNLHLARQRSNNTEGVTYFIIVNGTEGIRQEADGYAIMTTLELDGSASDALPYVRYLTSHLTPYGGFQTTQATSVGLDALAKFASKIFKDPLDIDVTATGALQKSVSLTSDNKILVQRFKVSEVPSELDIEAEGSGCGLVQAVVKYNVKNPPNEQLFSLDVSSKCTDKDCSEAVIHVTVSYLPPDLIAGMSLVEVKLQTGFAADQESLNNVKSNKKNNIIRIDIQDNTVIFYLTEISNTPQEFSFNTLQVVEVENRQPGSAKVYDYYANENGTSTTYKTDGD